ncbi:MAG: SpoIIE family protein phosphatase, partial [Clostridia bacterium]
PLSGWDDRICCLLGLATLVLGGMRWVVFEQSLGGVLAVLWVMVSAWAGGMTMAIPVGSAMGLTLALGGAAPEWMIVLSVCGLIASLLRNQRRVWIGIACVLGNALTIYCLNGSTQVVLPFATLVVGWLFFCLIPEEGMTWLRAALQVVDGDQTGIPAMGQQAMAHWVTDCARALQRMSNALPSQTPEALRPIQLTEQVANRLCDGCVRQTDCWDTHYAETLSMLSDMLEETLQSETSIREIAQRARTQGCQRADLLPPLLESTNRARQRRAKHAVRQAQARKLAIAQMHGQAGMLQTLAGTLGETVGCDAQEQTEIRRALWHTPWRDCTWLACRVDDMLQVSVQGAAQAPEQIEKLRILLSRALQSTLEYHLPEDEEDMDNLLFLERTALTVQVGIACEPVFGETQPGDSYLARKMANGLQFLAISDGMGNGLQAQRQSKTAISLLYNCLVAGYGRRDALETVNGLMLACQGEETYATMDLCLLDLETGEAVFDKLGACASYLLRQGKCRKLGGETLPVGILEAVSPRSFRIRMREEDLLLLCSDGIMEAFGLDDAIVIHALAGLNAEDPQGFAEAFMRRAMHAAGDKARDDMTVLVARVVPNAEVKAAQ